MAKRKIRASQSIWIIEWQKIFYLIVVAFFLLLTPGQNTYTTFKDVIVPDVHRLPFPVTEPAPYPVNQTDVYPGMEVTATAVAVYDIDSGVYLYKRNELMPLEPASTTKILSALVALDYYKLDDVLTVKQLMNDGQNMHLVAGERMTVENLLFGTLVESANDAVYTLAENYPGGVDKFVNVMNQKAKALHLDSSRFTNPVGFDDPNHIMTALDLVRLASYVLTNPTIAMMVAIPQITISDVTHTYFHSLSNVNQLLGKIPGVGGIKTGWTEEAGENLVTLVERNDHRIIIVILKSQDRFGDTKRVIDWVFANYQWQRFHSTH